MKNVKETLAVIERFCDVIVALTGGAICAVIFGGLAAFVNPLLGLVVGVLAFYQGTKDMAKHWREPPEG